jgi:hypothetical protein
MSQQVQEGREKLKEALAKLKEELRRLAEDGGTWREIYEFAEDAYAFLLRRPDRFVLRFSVYGEPPKVHVYIYGAPSIYYARYEDAGDMTVRQIFERFFGDDMHLVEMLLSIASALKNASKDMLDRIRDLEERVRELERELEGEDP